MFHKIKLFIISVTFLSSCAIYTTDPEVLNNYLTHSYNYPSAECYKATLAALKNFKIEVKKTDPKLQTIMTRKTAYAKGVQGYVGPSGGAQAVAYENSHKYYFHVTGDDHQCTVKTIKYQVWYNKVEVTRINKNYFLTNLWDPFFKEIQTELEER